MFIMPSNKPTHLTHKTETEQTNKKEEKNFKK